MLLLLCDNTNILGRGCHLWASGSDLSGGAMDTYTPHINRHIAPETTSVVAHEPQEPRRRIAFFSHTPRMLLHASALFPCLTVILILIKGRSTNAPENTNTQTKETILSSRLAFKLILGIHAPLYQVPIPLVIFFTSATNH